MLSDRERDCRSKKTYFTRADAKRYRKECQAKYGRLLKVYKCSCCPFYHLTTNRNYTVLEGE